MALSTAKHIFTKYPLVKGMLAYSVTWPTGNIIQQTMDGKRWGNFIQYETFISFTNSIMIYILSVDTYDWTKCAQFAVYGSLYVAPTLYCWVKLMSKIWPVSNFRTAIMKTAVEQLSYGPLATSSFFFIISLLEHKTIEESKQEVRDKFWPTYQMGVFYWTTVQILNYALIPERNRVPVVSIFGLIWTIFLAYQKNQTALKLKATPHTHSEHNENKVQYIESNAPNIP